MADASYVIDIAASMPAGEATSAQLDALVQNLTGAGKGADFFQVAMKQLSGSLSAAKAASAAANASLAEGTATYRELEKAANVAAKASEKAALSGKLDPSMAREAHQADQALQAYAHTLKSLEQNAASATKAETQFATQLANVQKLSAHTDKTLASAAETTEKLRFGLNSVPGPVGKIGSALLAPVQGFQKLSSEMGASNAAALLAATGYAAVVVAVVAVTVAIVAAAVAVAAWAVGLADANRTASLHSAAVAAMSPELDGLRGTFADLTKSTGLQSDQLEELAAKLQAAKTPADRMAGALADAALQEAALGKGGADKFIANITASKGAVTGLASTTRTALGGIVAQQLRGLDAQGATFKKNIGQLFGDLNIEPVLAGLEKLGALFDQNTASGQTLKFLFETIFQPLIDQANNAATVIEAFALGFEIGLLKLYIALKPTIKAIAEFFGTNDPSLADTLKTVTQVGEAAAFVIAGLGAAFVAVAALALAPIAIIGALGVSLGVLIGYVINAAIAIGGVFVNAFESVKAYLAGLPDALKTMGVDIMRGLAAGITGGVSEVVGAMTGAVGSAIDAAKHKLGIASPSKVFAQIGAYTGEGFAQGVDDSAPDAQASMTSMADPAPAAARAQAGGASAAPSGGGGASAPTVHIENLWLAGAKASDAETQSLSEALTRLIRGDAAALGGEAAPA